ncbi:MAG: proprotein convertase P-domain-containing protein [Candidatus Limnocylindria bacterium]
MSHRFAVGIALLLLGLAAPAWATIYTSTDVPKSIGPNAGTITTSVLNVPDSGSITDVNVNLTIRHTFDADLDVFLSSPGGTIVELFTDVGGSGDNFINTTLDDSASTSITAGTAPFTGTFRPEGVLADFNGENPFGTWTLRITDDLNGDAGTLDSWSLDIQSRAAVPEPAAVALLMTGVVGLLLQKLPRRRLR